MAAQLVTVTSNALGASTLTLVDGTTSTGYRVVGEPDFGNVVWDVAFSGPRGTQGARAAGSVPQNRPLVIPLLIEGTSKDNAASRMSDLYAVADELRRFGGRVRWRSKNQTYAQSFDVMSGQCSIQQFGFQGEALNRPIVTFEAVCAPYLLWDSMEVTDDFSSDQLSDYTFDAGAASNVAVTGGQLDAVANLTTENVVAHTETGYTWGDVQVTAEFTYQRQTNYKAGVRFKRTSATDYLVVYIDDTGTNSRLRLDKVVAGTPTNLQSTTLGARVADGATFWVRGRVEGDTVYREYFTSEPTPMGTPASAPTEYALAGAEATAFGSAVKGGAGWVWAPQHTDAKMGGFTVEPYVRRNVTLPASWSLYGSILGDAPALASVETTRAQGAAGPVFGLIAWTPRPGQSSFGSYEAFGIFEGEDVAESTTWTITADADYRGGSGLQTTTSGAGTATAKWQVDPSLLMPDDYTQGEVDIELWARVELASTVVSPTINAYVWSTEAPTTEMARYTNEWGTTGKSLTIPSSGTRFRFVRIGSIPLPVDRTTPVLWQPRVTATWAAGSSGTYGLDYLMIVLSRGRALSPTAKPIDTNPATPRYPAFFPSNTDQLRKIVRSDLTGTILTAAGDKAQPTHGLGGNLLELPTGDVDVLVKLSSLVPDDPTSSTDSEVLSHAATVKVSVTPRGHFLRDA